MTLTVNRRVEISERDEMISILCSFLGSGQWAKVGVSRVEACDRILKSRGAYPRGGTTETSRRFQFVSY